MKIFTADSEGDFRAGRELLLEYAESLGIDLCFQNFDRELETLATMYGPPKGCFLIARNTAGNAAGCVALRELAHGVCEMKRLYVRKEHRGSGVGQLLAEAVISRARQLGYARMVLDTPPAMAAARHLYASFGFKPTAPYYANPLEGVQFMALDLIAGPRDRV